MLKFFRKKIFTLFLLLSLIAIGVFAYLFLGVYVIQPMGVYPGGATFIYWRSGMHLPFMASADSIVAKTGFSVSPISRGIALARYSKPIFDRKIAQFGYSKVLYLWSTGGKTYEK